MAADGHYTQRFNTGACYHSPQKSNDSFDDCYLMKG